MCDKSGAIVILWKILYSIIIKDCKLTSSAEIQIYPSMLVDDFYTVVLVVLTCLNTFITRNNVTLNTYFYRNLIVFLAELLKRFYYDGNLNILRMLLQIVGKSLEDLHRTFTML
jgi:hypothetical protein